MSLYEAIKEVSDEENKIEGKDVAANEKEPTHADTRENPGAKEEEEDKPPTAKGTDKGAAEPDDKNPKAAPADKVGKDEPKPAEGAGKDPTDAPAEGEDGLTGARLRYELAQAKRRADAAEAKLKEAPTQPQPGPARTARTETEKAVLGEPDKNLDPEAHMKWELSQTKDQLKKINDWKEQKEYDERRVELRDNAIKSYTSYENEFKETVADYGEVTKFGVNAIASSIRTLNPNLQGEALMDAVKHKVLELGAQAEARGEQPAEFFYRQSKAWGYKPEPPKAEEPPAEPRNPSVKKIAEHKARSGTSLTPGGKSGPGPVSKEMVMSGKMSLADFGKLSPSQLRELEAME